MADDRGKEQQKLANVVKSLHKQLRRKYRESGQEDNEQRWEHVWHQHVEERPQLEEYSHAMHQLARCVWKDRGQSRLQWCVDVCREYFLGVGMRNILMKERRRRLHRTGAAVAQADQSTSNDLRAIVNSEWHCQLLDTQADILWKKALKCPCSMHTNWQKSPLVGSEGIQLLDVGSCYNPFVEFDGFQPIAIDLAPAVDTGTLQADFTKVDVISSVNCLDFLRRLTSPVTSLPAASFHVVTLCLFLSYLPSPEQRWLCCTRSHELLLPGGLLLIVTPDSSHVGRHAAIMRSWREDIERIGFCRWRYEKQQHLHCMAFRRLPGTAVKSPIGALAIPQDNQENSDSDEDDTLFSGGRTAEDDQVVADSFSLLPSFNDDSDG